MFKIHTDRLRYGGVEKIDLTAPSDFLEVKEEELSFPFPVRVQGEAYLTDEHLVIHLQLQTEAQIPCAICNKFFNLSINIPNFYYTTPLEELKSATFDFSSAVREDIILQIPQFAECIEKGCPERTFFSSYLVKEKDDEQYPFSKL